MTTRKRREFSVAGRFVKARDDSSSNRSHHTTARFVAARRQSMSNVILLIACLLIGILLRRLGKVPENAPATINAYIVHVALPALALEHIHEAEFRPELFGAVLMPWLLFTVGAALFWVAARTFHLSRGTTGALMMLGGLGNTSFIGLPMIDSFYGSRFLPIGILIDQLGSYLILGTLGILIACIYSSGQASWRGIARRIATFPPLIAMLLALALIPFSYPDWLIPVLHRLGGTLAPLALISVGLQLRVAAFRGNCAALTMGLGYKLVLAPAMLGILYFGGSQSGNITRVTLFESAMAPMIGASIVAIQHGLNPPLVTLMVGVGTILSFATLPLWWQILSAI
jgi:malate permease and related proteins